MSLSQKNRFVTISISGCAGAVIVMTLLDVFSLGLLYICSFASVLTAFVALDAPTFNPSWYQRVKIIVFSGTVGLIAITTFRISQFL